MAFIPVLYMWLNWQDALLALGSFQVTAQAGASFQLLCFQVHHFMLTFTLVTIIGLVFLHSLNRIFILEEIPHLNLPSLSLTLLITLPFGS